MRKKTLILFLLFLGLIFWQIDPMLNAWQSRTYLILVALLGVYVLFFKRRFSVSLEMAYKNEKKYETSLGDITFNFPNLSKEKVKMIDEKLKEIQKKYPIEKQD